MGKRILAIFVGLIAGFIAVSLFLGISSVMHPMPDGLEMSDKEGMIEFVKSLPSTAFIIVLFGHLMGAFTAAFVASMIKPEDWKFLAILLGAFFLIAGIANLFQVPHPKWFMIADVLTYLPAAWFGGKFGGRLTPQRQTTNTESDSS